MLTEKTYVRFPADIESMSDPRVFACGQITKIDEFKKTATVKIHDPFQYSLFFEDTFWDLIFCKLHFPSIWYLQSQEQLILVKIKPPHNLYYGVIKNKYAKIILKIYYLEFL